MVANPAESYPLYSSFFKAYIILTDPVVQTVIGIFHAAYSLMMLVAISKTLAGNMDMK